MLQRAWRWLKGEGRATLAEPEDWMWEAFGATPADTGERITPHRALTVPALWRGINLLANATSKVPLHVMARTGEDGGKEKARNHPAFRTLRQQFNPYLTAHRGRALLTLHRILHGNGYALIDRTSSPWQLIPLDPTTTWPIRVNGRLWYVFELAVEVDESGQVVRWEERRVEASDILHLMGLSFDGLAGVDVITLAKNDLAMSLAARKFGAKFFSNNAQHSIALEAPDSVPKDYAQALLRDWNKIRKGLENAHKAALFQHGVKASIISSTAKEAQLVELRQFELVEIANIIGVPAHMLGSSVNSSYGSLEQENQRFLDHSLDPLLCEWEEECAAKLLRERERRNDTHTIEAQREAVVSVDFKTRVDGIVAQVNNGLISDNEARRLLSLPQREDGDRFRLPSNVVYVDDEEQERQPPPAPPAPPPPPDDRARTEGARRCVEDAAGRMVTRLVGLARKGRPLAPERETVRCALAPALIALMGEDRSEAAADWLIEHAPGVMGDEGARAGLPKQLLEHIGKVA